MCVQRALRCRPLRHPPPLVATRLSFFFFFFFFLVLCVCCVVRAVTYLGAAVGGPSEQSRVGRKGCWQTGRDSVGSAVGGRNCFRGQRGTSILPTLGPGECVDRQCACALFVCFGLFLAVPTSTHAGVDAGCSTQAMDPRLSETEVIVRAPRVEIPRIEFLGCRPGRWLRDEVRDFQWQGKAGLCVEYAGVRTRCCYRIGGVCIHGCVSPQPVQVINNYCQLLLARHERQRTAAKDAGKSVARPCHVFNSFFFSKLTGPSGCEYNYRAVRRWTRKVMWRVTEVCLLWRSSVEACPGGGGCAVLRIVLCCLE